MDANQKKLKNVDFEAAEARAKPTQIPFNCVKKSYEGMLQHCRLQDVGNHPFWACSKNGARVHCHVTYRNVWNRDGSLNAAMMPVATLYCSGCHLKPQIKSGDPIWADEIQTLSM